MPDIRADLETLTRIPSVSLDAFDQAHVEASATAVAELLRAEGLEVEIVREGGRPAVIGHVDGPAGAPTVLLYAHHDVQPPGDDAGLGQPAVRADRARRPALRPRRRRRQGRGHGPRRRPARARRRAAGRGHRLRRGRGGDRLRRLATILERHGEKLRADAIVLADSTNWAVGEPALTTTLRGMIRVVADRPRPWTTASTAACSAAPCPTPSPPWCASLASLHDDDGEVAVAGLRSGEASDLEFTEEQLRADSGLLDGVQTIGSGSLLSRLWTKPSITDDRHRRALGGHLLQHAGAVRGRQGLRAPRARRGPARGVPAAGGAPARARPVGRPGRRAPRRRGRRLLRRRAGPGLRRGARRVRRRVGRAAGRHRRRRVDPVRGGVRREVPRRRDPGHRRRGPRHAGARRQRERCTWASSSGCASPRRCCSSGWARCRADPLDGPASDVPAGAGPAGARGRALSPCWSRRAGRASGRAPPGPSARPRGRP